MTPTDQPDTTPAPAPDKPNSVQPATPTTRQKPKTPKKKKSLRERVAEKETKLAERRAHLALEREQRTAVEQEAQDNLIGLLERVESGVQVSPFDGIQHPKKRAFLCAYALLGVKGRACGVVGIDSTTIYTTQWTGDAEFTEELERARCMAADILLAEAHRRAVDGVEEPVGWYMGVPGAYVRRYSDNLLMFLIKGADPERYRERVDVRAVYAHIDLNRLSDEQLARVSAGEELNYIIATSRPAALPPASSDSDSTPEGQGSG